ncbi:alpha/beta hydrolase [Emticicia agri]|uniref:Alpha/beta fold hydrolase n=1 Tax=Emticicia agri TaxID=2492393 RepID=A0A4Q5LQR4_9BACT|nr:alpha/beta hydrolase [Emticicia agri]RYU91795.1 alpha/beta fold hydrolase [Emticicia agri]
MQKLKHLYAACMVALLSVSCSESPFEPELATITSFHVKNGDYLIPVMVRGNTASKKIILYVQGGPALNTLDYATIDYPEWKNTLEKDYAIAYYEQRGTGNKQGRFSYGDSILDTYVEDLHTLSAFLKKAYDAEIIMMGHSFGGALVMRYMLEKSKEGIPTQYIVLNAPVTTDNGLSEKLRWKFRHEFLQNSATLEISRGNHVNEWIEVFEWLKKNPEIKKLDGENPYQLMIQWNNYVEDLIYISYPEKSLKVRDYMKAIFASPYNPVPVYIGTLLNESDLRSLILKEEEKYEMLYKLNKIDHQNILMVTGRFDDICVPEELNYVYSQIYSTRRFLIYKQKG